jgi:hypothetical protein
MCPFFHYTWLSSVLFLLSGISLGALGAGGSLLALPIFVHVLGLPLHLAIPATAGTIAVASASGAWETWRSGRLDKEVALRFGLPGVALALAASFAVPRVPESVLNTLFVGLLLVAGIRLLVGRETDRAKGSRTWRLPLAGAATGAATGLLGVGGGFLATPALILEGGLTAAAAAPVSLLTMAVNASASLVGHIAQGTFRWTLVLPALIAVMLGMELGTALGRRASPRVLRSALGLLVLGIASFTIWSTWIR